MELGGLLTNAGLRLEVKGGGGGREEGEGRALSTLENALDLHGWMDTTNTPPSARVKIEQAFETELKGGSPTGMRAFLDEEGRACFVHTWAVAKAVKP